MPLFQVFEDGDDQVDIDGAYSIGGTDLTKSGTHKRAAGSDAEGADAPKPAKKTKKDGKKKVRCRLLLLHLSTELTLTLPSQLATYDASISLTEDQFTSHRHTYEERMANEQAKAAKTKNDKDECARALDTIFDVPAMCEFSRSLPFCTL